MNSILPSETRRLRACMLCSLVKTQTQFKLNGCENCEQVLHLRGDNERIADCTSANFEGLIGFVQPSKSWVGRWQRIDKFNKGMYAIRVNGRLPISIEEELQDKGIRYRARDGSHMD